MNSIKNGLILLTLLVSFLQPGHAQDAKKVDTYQVDFAATEVSANAILNVKDDNIVRPGNVRKFTLGYLSSAFDKGARPIGAEWAFFQSFLKSKTLDSYRKNLGLYSLTLSAAFANPTDGPMRVGWGFTYTPVDQSDPLRSRTYYTEIERYCSIQSQQDTLNAFDWAGTVANVIRGIQPGLSETEVEDVSDIVVHMFPMPVAGSDTSVKVSLEQFSGGLNAGGVPSGVQQQGKALYDKIQEVYPKEFTRKIGLLKRLSNDYSRAIESAKKKFRDSHWNATAVRLGAGQTLNSPDGVLSRFAGDWLCMYGTVAFSLDGPLSKEWKHKHQFIAQIKYTLPQHVGEKEGVTADTIRNVFSLGIKAYAGTAQRRGLVEVVFSNFNGLNQRAMSSWQLWVYKAGYEFRIAEGLYASAETGFSQSTFDPTQLKLLALTNLKYTFGAGKIKDPK